MLEWISLQRERYPRLAHIRDVGVHIALQPHKLAGTLEIIESVVLPARTEYGNFAGHQPLDVWQCIPGFPRTVYFNALMNSLTSDDYVEYIPRWGVIRSLHDTERSLNLSSIVLVIRAIKAARHDLSRLAAIRLTGPSVSSIADVIDLTELLSLSCLRFLDICGDGVCHPDRQPGNLSTLRLVDIMSVISSRLTQLEVLVIDLWWHADTDEQARSWSINFEPLSGLRTIRIHHNHEAVATPRFNWLYKLSLMVPDTCEVALGHMAKCAPTGYCVEGELDEARLWADAVRVFQG